MRACLLIVGMCLALNARFAAANEFCGEAPAFSDPTVASGVARAVLMFSFWSGSGDSFARLAANQYSELAARRSPDVAYKIAIALLHAECQELLRDQDPANLPWHFKDRFVGLSKIVPDFREAYALLERIEAAEARRQ